MHPDEEHFRTCAGAQCWTGAGRPGCQYEKLGIVTGQIYQTKLSLRHGGAEKGPEERDRCQWSEQWDGSRDGQPVGHLFRLPRVWLEM
jgi:hypothetical protein